MKYTVYHCVQHAAMFNTTLTEQLWREARGLCYTKVAEVEASDLEYAYILTNHDSRSEGAWQKYPGVTVHAHGPQRSTSKGDVIVQGSDAWVVDSGSSFTALPSGKDVSHATYK